MPLRRDVVTFENFRTCQSENALRFGIRLNDFSPGRYENDSLHHGFENIPQPLFAFGKFSGPVSHLLFQLGIEVDRIGKQLHDVFYQM